MGFLNDLVGHLSKTDKLQNNLIGYGKQKKDGSHDHRTNTGNDRTPAQKEGDKKRQRT